MYQLLLVQGRQLSPERCQLKLDGICEPALFGVAISGGKSQVWLAGVFPGRSQPARQHLRSHQTTGMGAELLIH